MQAGHARLTAADRADAERLRLNTRVDMVMRSPEAAVRRLVACALLLRVDLSADYALLFLRQAPELRTRAEVWAWVEAIPKQFDQETMQ